MEKEFVPYEQALALKELGFNEMCIAFYFLKQEEIVYAEEGGFWVNSNYYKERVSAPLYQQAFKWFREKYQVYPIITLDQTTYPKFSYDITEFTGNPINLSEKEWGWEVLFSDGLYRTYEEAELECLKKLIEIVKNKSL